jgi:anti-sigma factor (TIGR02949 family)
MSDSRPIDCEQVVRLLFAYLDGEIGDEQRRDVDHHLARCRSCFSRAEFEKRLRSHLLELGHGAVSPELEQRIRSLIGTPPAADSTR